MTALLIFISDTKMREIINNNTGTLQLNWTKQCFINKRANSGTTRLPGRERHGARVGNLSPTPQLPLSTPQAPLF
ncbi:hypothetical protein J6590_028208 [Homalodisca vitripennis]|nr:hypothetical protein J6590_028208 [Homalodisca vitripennis]